jgi:hypothetical protein
MKSLSVLIPMVNHTYLYFLFIQIDSGSVILTLNNKTTYRNKYEVANSYNLVIKSVQFQDEGLYECDTGEQRLTVALQVAGA